MQTGGKTANINIKMQFVLTINTCNLFRVLMATDQKPQKS